MHELDAKELGRSLTPHLFTVLERERDRQQARRVRRWRTIRRRALFALMGVLFLVAVWLLTMVR